MHNQTIIVVWEGVEGAGKTTLLKKTSEILESMNLKTISYKTPSDTPTGVFAKKYGNRLEIDHLTRMLLFLANTSDDSARMKKDIELNNPDYYFIDRYYLCSIVYGFALSRSRGEDVGEIELIQMINLIEKAGSKILLKPDIYVIVDVVEEDRRRRLEGRGEQKSIVSMEDVIEQDTTLQDFVRGFYRVLYETGKMRLIWIENVEGRLEEAAWKVVNELLELRKSYITSLS
ncbi:MAG: hypothetical protein ABDH32_01045 [Candidatus Caldarchaeales archaeon]